MILTFDNRETLPYRTKIRRTKLSKFRLGVENFVQRKILSNISIQKSLKNRTKLSKFRLGVENFVRRNILSDEIFSDKVFKFQAFNVTVVPLLQREQAFKS